MQHAACMLYRLGCRRVQPMWRKSIFLGVSDGIFGGVSDAQLNSVLVAFTSCEGQLVETTAGSVCCHCGFTGVY